jgi:hypothetical protein
MLDARHSAPGIKHHPYLILIAKASVCVRSLRRCRIGPWSASRALLAAFPRLPSRHPTLSKMARHTASVLWHSLCLSQGSFLPVAPSVFLCYNAVAGRFCLAMPYRYPGPPAWVRGGSGHRDAIWAYTDSRRIEGEEVMLGYRRSGECQPRLSPTCLHNAVGTAVSAPWLAGSIRVGSGHEYWTCNGEWSALTSRP